VGGIDYAIDVWDLSGTDGRPDTRQLLQHLRDFGAEGWELCSLAFNVDLACHGPSHLLVFKRAMGGTMMVPEQDAGCTGGTSGPAGE
jgi:hypothetical protein